jgi:pimeloyl-ACP methyl ester carboxylesterase
MKKIIMGLALAASSLSGAHALNISAPAPSAAAKGCTAKTLPENARCGVVRVLENRRKPNGRGLDIHYAVAPGTNGAKLDPIYFIAGGPGQSAIDTAQIILAEIRAVDKLRDVVLIDQRGTGRSNPLNCPESFGLLVENSSKAVAACIASLSSRADLRHYLTADAIQDMDAVRAALGHEKISIAAASYGVRPALAYMRRYPKRVRSAVLRSANAPDFNIIKDGLGNAERELDRMIAECAADPKCNAAFPQVRQQIVSVENRLRAKPETIAAPGGDVVVSAELFHQMIYALLLSPQSRQQLPFIISTAATKGFAPLAPITAAVRNALYGTVPIGMYLSILCSEDVPRMTSEELNKTRSGIGNMASRIGAVCQSWPRGKVAKDFFEPFKSTIPTLILTGEYDPAMTFDNGEQLRKMLVNSKHILLRGAAHGPLFPPCVHPAIGRLLNTGSTAGINSDCSQGKLPPFHTP